MELSGNIRGGAAEVGFFLMVSGNKAFIRGQFIVPYPEFLT